MRRMLCRKLSYGDCVCGWRAEFGERWEDHAPHQGFTKDGSTHNDVTLFLPRWDGRCGRCGWPDSAHGEHPKDGPDYCGWTLAMVQQHRAGWQKEQ